jgi:predicted methyltransferase
MKKNLEKVHNMRLNIPPIITSETAKSLLDEKTRVSLDLGLSETRVKQTKQEIMLTDVESIDRESLVKISQDPRSVYFVRENNVFMAAIGGKHFYKLAKTEGAPTLEIDGIRMHRTKDTTPDRDTEKKLEMLGIRGGCVLDTCMGLGYTAIQAQKCGAECVVSVEFEPNVIRIAQLNPWSRGLFTEESIHLVLGDSFFVVDGFPMDYFDYVVHDPPRHSSAGHLYGQVFYDKLAWVLKPGGRLFHYTGEPRSRYRKVNIHRGIVERLGQSGFRDIVYHSKVMGFTCTLSTV